MRMVKGFGADDWLMAFATVRISNIVVTFSNMLTKYRSPSFCIAPFLLLAFTMVLVDTMQTSLKRTSTKPRIIGGSAIFSIALA